MANVVAIRNKYRAQAWIALIQECNTSGLANKAFCEQRGLSLQSYYYWLRKLRNQVAETTQPQLIHLDEKTPPVSEDMLEIRYRGAEIRMLGNANMDAVAALLRSMPYNGKDPTPEELDLFMPWNPQLKHAACEI